MRGRAKELYYEYCAPKPVFFFRLWDSNVERFPPNEECPEEVDSINIYVHLVV